MQLKKIIIALDGYSSCGKSTLAKALAKSLDFVYIDTGAMYRAVTYFFIKNKVDINDGEAIRLALENIHIHFESINQENYTFLNNQNIEDEIRKMYVSEQVSQVAAISLVRRAMVKQQQQMGNQKGIVMDGRDIGTVVFPDAELKLFLTADPEIRAQRRFEELKAKKHDVSLAEIKANLMHRDRIDSTREDSPLRQADDAIVIDNSSLSESEQLDKVLNMIYELAG